MTALTYVIPIYNGERTIERTISSIIRQAGELPKIIAVDDGSTDETTKVISLYEDQVTLLRQQNAGPAAARNFGLQSVETEIVCFVDADDYVMGPHSQMVEKNWNRDVDIIVGLAAEANDDNIHLVKRNKFNINDTSDNLLRNWICDYCVQTSTLSWSTTFLRLIGGWDKAVFGPDDNELAMRAFLHNPRVSISNDPGWVVWDQNSEPGRVSRTFNSRTATSCVYMHKKLIDLMDRKNCSKDTTKLFLQRCMKVGRMLYLNGFRNEAIELFSIAWNRGYIEHSGPPLEKMIAGCCGTKATLFIRNAIAQIKRKRFSR